MYKYEMIIDGTEYKALFENHFEAADFLDDNIRDGSQVVVNNYREVTTEEILTDDDFEWAYRIEMVAILLLPNHCDFKKWYHQEAELRRLGFIA